MLLGPFIALLPQEEQAALPHWIYFSYSEQGDLSVRIKLANAESNQDDLSYESESFIDGVVPEEFQLINPVLNEYYQVSIQGDRLCISNDKSTFRYSKSDHGLYEEATYNEDVIRENNDSLIAKLYVQFSGWQENQLAQGAAADIHQKMAAYDPSNPSNPEQLHKDIQAILAKEAQSEAIASQLKTFGFLGMSAIMDSFLTFFLETLVTSPDSIEESKEKEEVSSNRSSVGLLTQIRSQYNLKTSDISKVANYTDEQLTEEMLKDRDGVAAGRLFRQLPISRMPVILHAFVQDLTRSEKEVNTQHFLGNFFEQLYPQSKTIFFQDRTIHSLLDLNSVLENNQTNEALKAALAQIDFIPAFKCVIKYSEVILESYNAAPKTIKPFEEETKDGIEEEAVVVNNDEQLNQALSPPEEQPAPQPLEATTDSYWALSSSFLLQVLGSGALITGLILLGASTCGAGYAGLFVPGASLAVGGVLALGLGNLSFFTPGSKPESPNNPDNMLELEKVDSKV